MVTPKEPTIGFDFEDCDGIEITDGKFIGLDTAVRAVRTSNFRATGTVVISVAIAEAIAKQDKIALVRVLGLPSSLPPSVVGEALKNFADNRSNPDAALKQLKESTLAGRIGVAADLSALSQGFLQIIQSGALKSALQCLFS